MKKILSAVAALGLVAGVASVASAADLSVTGKYVVEGNYISNAGAGGGANPFAETASDAYYMHTFQMLPSLKVNDNITMKSDIRLRKEAKFGSSDEDTGIPGDSHGVDFNKLYMVYTNNLGTFTIGRTPAGAWGTPFLDSAGAASRIMFAPNMGSAPVSVMLYTQKTKELDGQATVPAADQDTDQYHVGVKYSQDNTTAALGYWQNRNGATDLTDTMIDAMGVFKFGNFTVVGDFVMVGGDETATTDWDAKGLLLMGSGQFDNLTASVAYVYASGDDAATADNEGLMNKTKGLGKDFQPLYIFTGDAMGILNQDEKSGVYNGTTDAVGAADFGVHCIAAFVDYKVSDKLTLHGGIAMGKADDTSNAGDIDDSYGMEYDLGAAYKLLDNLTYEAHLGYVAAGDFFEEADAGEAQDITVLTHSLTMKF